MNTPVYTKRFFRLGEAYYEKSIFKYLICLRISKGISSKHTIYFVFNKELYDADQPIEILAASCEDENSVELLFQMYLEAVERFMADEGA